MPTFESIAWFPLCAGLTGVGLVATWLLWRRRGAASGLRLAAWSLLPMAAYLTGAVDALWQIGTAVAGWAAGVIISPTVWAGIALAGVSAVGFVVSGTLRARKGEGSTERPNPQEATSASPTDELSASAGKKQRKQVPAGSEKKAGGGSDDLSDVEEILRKRGIT